MTDKKNGKSIITGRKSSLSKKYKSILQGIREFIAPYEKATSDFFGNPLEKIEKNYQPSKRKKTKKTKK